MSGPAWRITTPIDSFVSPDNESEIDIVSTLHVGPPGYYRDLGAHIMKRQDQGFTVHYELEVSDDEIEEKPGKLAISERFKRHLAWAGLDIAVDILDLITKELGYVEQTEEALFREEGSYNIDLTEAQVVRSLGVISHIGMLATNWLQFQSMKKTLQRKPDAFREYVFKNIAKGIAQSEKDRVFRDWGDRIIIDRRNEAALHGVDASLCVNPAARLVLIWGLGHLQGLGHGLLNRGYQHIGRKNILFDVNTVILHEASIASITGDQEISDLQSVDSLTQ